MIVVVVIRVVVVSSSPSGMKAVVVAEMGRLAEPISSGGGGNRGGAAAVEAGGVVSRKPVGGATVVNGEGPVAVASEVSRTIPPSRCWMGGWNGGKVEDCPPRAKEETVKKKGCREVRTEEIKTLQPSHTLPPPKKNALSATKLFFWQKNIELSINPFLKVQCQTL